MYLTTIGPDLMYMVSLISLYIERPTELHQQAMKKIIRYLKGTIELGILYRRGGKESLIAYFDNDYAGNIEDRKSMLGYVFLLSSVA